MKKKLLFICLMYFILVFAVNAEVLSPKSNTSGLESGTTVEMNSDDGFDFSLVNFSAVNSSDKDLLIKGKTNLKKIYSIVSTTDNSYFTAYCLNEEKKYPEYSKIYSNNYSENKSDLIKYMALFEILKECSSSNCNLLDNLGGRVTAYSLDGIDTPSESTITSFTNNETISVDVSNIGFVVTSMAGDYFKSAISGGSGSLSPILTNTKTYDYNELSTALNIPVNNNKITVSFKKEDFLTNHYTVSDMPTELSYKKALWIIEHSYPTITVEEFVTSAGANYTTLKSELTSLYVDDIFTNDCTFTSNKLTCTDLGLSNVTIEGGSETAAKQAIKDAIPESTITKLVENYVYGTTQYAIWNVMGGYTEMVQDTDTNDYYKSTLGDTLYGSTELNKIYQYLLVDRTDEYNKYDNSNYTNDLEISKPNKESYKSTSDSEYYGPYTVKSSMLYTDTSSIKVALLSNNDNIALVDSNLNELTFTKVNTYTGDQAYLNDKKIYSLNSDLVFYVKMSGSDKTTTSLSLALIGSGKNYPNAQKRGKILYSESALDQVVGISAVLENVDVLKQVTIEYNAKTADVNIGYVLVALLVSFVFGYIALRYNKAPIDNL